MVEIEKQNQLQKALKTKQIAIYKTTKVDTNTNRHKTFNFWKGMLQKLRQ
jgi:hypothetical protein